MPDTELAAKRYSQAVFEIALEGKNAAVWQSALDRMADFMSRADVSRVLENTRADQAVKQQLIDAALNDLPPQAHNLAKLLARKGRTNLARDIASQFRELVEAQEGIAHARAITAVPLTDTERDELARRLQEQTGRQIILETEVDPSLIGGVIVQIGDRMVDASTRARLAALRESLVSAVH